MTDLLSIGSSAVKNSQLALTVVSNNIANVNTEGYVKQSLIYEENTPASLGRFSSVAVLLLTAFVEPMTVW